MKKLNRCLSLVGLAAISVGAVSALSSCDKRETFLIWCADNATETTQTLVDEFIETYPEFDELYKVSVMAHGEGDAATDVITDVGNAADVFFFAQDQLSRLVQVGGLSAIPSSSVSEVTSRNDEASISAATSGETLYAYPATADNGYFVFYDKSVPGLEEEMTKEGGADQTKLIEIATEQNRTISFELTDSGWYLASYFIATGCESTWYTDENGDFISYVDNWNSPEGVTALEGAYELISNSQFVNNSDGSTAFNSDAMLIVDGTWDTTVIQNILGDNMGVAPLWNFTVAADDSNSVATGTSETFHLGSFYGCKLVGVKPQTDGTKNGWAHLLANYLTDEHAQLLRYEELGWGPSNVKAQATEEVQNDAVLAAFNEQAQYSVVQGEYPNDWWTITQNFGAKIGTSGGTDEALKSLLADYEADIEGIIGKIQGDYAITGTLADEYQWSVGPIVGVSKYALYEGNAEEGTYKVEGDVVHGRWTVEVVLDGANCFVDTTTEIGLVRVVDYGDWTGNWGYTHLTNKTGYYDWNGTAEWGNNSDNNIGALPGTYTLVFDYTGNTPTITMTAA